MGKRQRADRARRTLTLQRRMVQSMTDLLEEISQQPAALSGLRKFYASPGAIPAKGLRSLTTHWPPTVVFTGMGSSLFAAYPAQAYLTEQGVRALVWETAELVHHHLKVLRPDTLLVVVSQSGQTAEVLALAGKFARQGARAGGDECGSQPSGKAREPASALDGRRAGGRQHQDLHLLGGRAHVPGLCHRGQGAQSPYPGSHARGGSQEEILERREVLMPPIVEFFNRPPYVALMSRGADLATAYQGALMLKEVARLAAEPISAAQFRHGPMEIISPNHRYILFARQGKTGKLLLKLPATSGNASGRVLLFTDMPFDDPMNVRLVRVEPLRLGLGTLVDSVYIQLLAYEAALRAGLEPGQV